MERQWTEEVLYLHSLWRRGPSHPSPAAAAVIPRLRPSAQLKKTHRKQRRKKAAPTPSAISDVKWPCPPPPAPRPDDDRWPDAAPKAVVSRAPVPAEEKARAAAILLQNKAISSCREFFQSNESDEDIVDEDEESTTDEEDEDGEETEVFKFLLDLFKKDPELRGYYEKNYEKGDFCCLICESMGIKVGRKFPDCISLVQHLNSIARTRRKEAHRALGRAVCQVLAWDASRLPSIVLAMGEPLGKSLQGPSNTKVDEQNVHTSDNPIDIHDDGNDVNSGIQRNGLAVAESNQATDTSEIKATKDP